MKTPTMAVQAANGRWFAVRYLPLGARYGRANTLTVDDHEMVEFYDLTSADDSDGEYAVDVPQRYGFGPLGQFVSRLHVATLLGEDQWKSMGGAHGLCLDGGNPAEWSVDGSTMRVVLSWMRRTRAEVRESARS